MPISLPFECGRGGSARDGDASVPATELVSAVSDVSAAAAEAANVCDETAQSSV